MSQSTSAPEWAIVEHALLAETFEAVDIFSGRCVDERGYLKCLKRRGGNDGGAEKAWAGILQQYTEAKVPGIEMAESGMDRREFVTSFDWGQSSEACVRARDQRKLS